MKMISRSLAAVIFLLAFSISYAEDKNVQDVPDWVGGLNQIDINRCNDEMEQVCKVSDGLVKYIECAKDSFSSKQQCQQNSFFLENNMGFFSLIKDYQAVSVVKAKVYAADHSEDFFMVDKKGQLISLTWHVDFGKNKIYQSLKKEFNAIDLWPIATSLPEVHVAADGSVRVIFSQLLLNGCHACEQAGIAKIAYDFSSDGEYLGASLVDIIPTSPAKGAIH